jgi:hypothetical protein
MPITSQKEHVAAIELELSSTSRNLSDEEMEQAAKKSMLELRWVYPIQDSFKEYWAIERGKRHALAILLNVSAHKFKYKQINLNQRFDHYFKLLKSMDEEFAKVIDDYPTIFPGVETEHGFTSYIPAGFEEDFLGRDRSPDTVDISGEDK